MVDISKAVKVSGWMKPKELEWLTQMATGCEKVLEVGSYHGRSTTALSVADSVYCVDLWGTPGIGDDDYKLFLKNTAKFKDRVTVLRGNSHDMLDKLIEDGEQFDMGFVDGCHKYKFVYGDIERVLKLVRKGGLICGHDYSKRPWPDVVRAVNELVPDFKHLKGTAIWWKKV